MGGASDRVEVCCADAGRVSCDPRPAVAAVSTADAQYFGRNKVQYRTFNFEILKTEHFDLYFYPGRSGGRRDRRADGRALERAAVAILRSRAARPAAVILYAVARALPPDQRRRRPHRRRHRRRHRSAEAPDRAADVRLAGRHRSRARPRARARVSVRHHRRRPARVDGDRARHPRSFRSGSSKGWRSTCRSVRSTRKRRCGCATRRSARSCRTFATSTTPSTFRTAGAMRSGRTSAPSTAIAPSRR